ncbi:MAG: hypothetical protein PHX60_01510 [Giesbergeria sp.]|uniref:hypothetical protein n=1 Tax=Giesbergeria sp. TaxID=2818473 RepID=UPI00261CC151|nr:hypothetical protein [Giesbergeria sp.]MDD2608356.1 hypothetical protein [Giesbergeria sp.]
MQILFSFLTTSPEAVVFVVLCIFASALVAYFKWYKPKNEKILEEINRLSTELTKKDQDWREIEKHLHETIESYPHIKDAWRETEGRVIKISTAGNNKYLMYGMPRDLWNASGLLSRNFNLALAEAVPNILVGIGLFFTFLFLSLALIGTTTALTDASSSKDTEAAISQLLKIAGSKFLTSLAGLLASILWTIFFRRSINKVSEACDDFLLALSKVISPAGGENITLHQLAVADEALKSGSDSKMLAEELLKKVREVTDQSLHSMNDSNALTEELLNEAREQTGTFKRFETDLAVSLASAINQAFTPQMQAMTERLVASIEGLSEKMGTMNQEALKTMLDDFAGMLKQATDAEMTQLQQTLQDLSNQLHGAGSMLEIQSGMAANAILNAGVEMQTQLKGAGDTLSAQTAEVATVIQTAGTQLAASTQEMSENLVQGAHQLEQATASIRLGFKDLGEVVELASAKGKEGIAQIHIALEKADLTVTQLSQTASGLSETAQGLVETGALVSNMVDNVQELAREQRAVVLSVREVVPNAMAAVQRVTEVLDQAAAQTLSSMQQTHQAMESTATALGKTVGSITEGAGVLAVRTQEMSENLVQGAHQLEQATASIRLGFKDLGEVVELASTKGKEGIAQVHIALEKADLTVAQLSQTASGLSETAQGLVETGALVSNMVDNVQELAREQRAVVLSVKEVAPNAMAAVERVTEVLDQAAAQTLSSMQQTRQAMESTATTLGKTVGSITEGVGVYSTQVAELHRQMDGQLAKAVGSFDQGVKDLSEVVEELTESLQSTVKTVRR